MTDAVDKVGREELAALDARLRLSLPRSFQDPLKLASEHLLSPACAECAPTRNATTTTPLNDKFFMDTPTKCLSRAMARPGDRVAYISDNALRTELRQIVWCRR
jgi:hypothetical protein